MKVAVLSESPADEAAVRILVSGILGRQTRAVALPLLRTRGESGVFAVLPVVFKHLHFHTGMLKRSSWSSIQIILPSIAMLTSSLEGRIWDVDYAGYAELLLRCRRNSVQFQTGYLSRLHLA